MKVSSPPLYFVLYRNEIYVRVSELVEGLTLLAENAPNEVEAATARRIRNAISTSARDVGLKE